MLGCRLERRCSEFLCVEPMGLVAHTRDRKWLVVLRLWYLWRFLCLCETKTINTTQAIATPFTTHQQSKQQRSQNHTRSYSNCHNSHHNTLQHISTNLPNKLSTHCDSDCCAVKVICTLGINSAPQ